MVGINCKVILCGIATTLIAMNCVLGEVEENGAENYYQDYKVLENTENPTPQNDSKSPHINRKITKEEVLKYLSGISGFKTISGVFFEYKEIDAGNKQIEIVSKTTGVFPGVLTQMMSIPSAGPAQWQYFINEAISNWNNGYLVHIVWLQWDDYISTLYDYKPTSNATHDALKWKDLTEDGGTLNNEWKKLLDAIAPYLLQLQNAGVVPICDILPYINFDHNWRGRRGTNGSQILYQLSHDYLTTKYEIKSIIWIWSLYIYGGTGQLDEISDFWPGTNYVDAVSIYTSTAQLSLDEYTKLIEVVGDKPISMEDVTVAPSWELISTQPRWTWFTLDTKRFNDTTLKASFRIPSVINKAQIEIFKNPPISDSVYTNVSCRFEQSRFAVLMAFILMTVSYLL